MAAGIVISVDGACSGKKAAAAAVLMIDGRIIGERSRFLWEVDGYVLAAELAGVALAAELAHAKLSEEEAMGEEITIEVDNADVPRVIREGYRPVQSHRIPKTLLEKAVDFCRLHQVHFRFLPRRSTEGMRRADRLASARLWRKGKARTKFAHS